MSDGPNIARVAGLIGEPARAEILTALLGGQALTALRRKTVPFVEFHDNPDPFSWAAALARFGITAEAVAATKAG